jgi:uncharacterized membrane protein YqiK
LLEAEAPEAEAEAEAVRVEAEAEAPKILAPPHHWTEGRKEERDDRGYSMLVKYFGPPKF